MKTSVSLSILFLALATFQVAADEPAKTGQGAGVYQVVRGWGEYSEGKKMGSLHGDMAADKSGNVYLSAGDGIHVFGPDGKFVKNLGPTTRGVHGMKVREQDGEEFLFTAQNGAKIVSKLKLDGTPVWQIKGAPEIDAYANGGKYAPTDVDLAPDGSIIVADGYGSSLMHIYDKDQKYVKTFGGKGKEDGQFNVCHNVLIDTRTDKPTLLISDRQNNRLEHYTMDGEFIERIADDLRQPCAADIFDGRLAVGELGGRVTIFDKDNKMISRLGDEPADRAKGNGAPPEKWIEGAVVSVHGLTFDNEGALYAMEWNRYGRTTKYVSVKE